GEGGKRVGRAAGGLPGRPGAGGRLGGGRVGPAGAGPLHPVAPGHRPRRLDRRRPRPPGPGPRRGPVGAAHDPAAPWRRRRVRGVRHLRADPAGPAGPAAAVELRADGHRAGHRHPPGRVRRAVRPPGGRVTTFTGPPVAEAEGVGALTLGGFLDEVADRFGPHEAIVLGDTRWTYAALRRSTHRLARGLAARGIGPGDRVGVLMGNRPEAVAGIFAAGLAGAVAVPLSTFAPRPELAFMVERAEIVLALTQETLL